MACSLISRNYQTGITIFSIDSSDDLSSLPTLNRNGKYNLNTINCVSQGSLAVGTDGKDYVLSGSNQWILYMQNNSSSNNKTIGMFEHTFDIGDIQLNPVNEYYSFGTAKFKGISAYDYIWKIADILSVQNVAPISEILQSNLITNTTGTIIWIRNNSDVFPFNNITISSIYYNKETLSPSESYIGIEFISPPALPSFSGQSSEEIYKFKGLVTAISK